MLNKKQTEIFDLVVKNRQPVTFITGSAGVGKSYLAAEIIKQYDSVELTASTHKARSILSQMAGQEAYTIHSYLGYRLQAVGYHHELQKTNYNFRIRPVDLVVLDEISMCPDTLLQELLDLVKDRTIAQLVILGDAVQLKAVSDAPALQSIKQYKQELTEQMRQDACPILEEYLSNLRHGIETNTMPILTTKAPALTFIGNHKDFIDEYNSCTTGKKIIAYRNTVVDKYNFNIHTGDSFNIGDDVIIDKPLGKSRNQDTVKIVTITETPTKFKLQVADNFGVQYLINHYKSTSYYESKLEAIKATHNTTKYWEVANASFRLKHLYAATAFKCQGESYDTVFVEGKDFMDAYQATKTRYNNPITLDMFLRLYYVAISRMRHRCVIYTGADNKGRDYKLLQKN